MNQQISIPKFALPAFIARVGARLPQWPHSLSLVCGLNIARKLGVLPEDTLAEIDGKTFRISVLDTGGTADFTVQNGVFKPLMKAVDTPDLHFSANLSAFLQLLSRQEDPDTLFFNRELTIEGDTELGLIVKNMLDAVDWSALTQSLTRLPLPSGLRERLSTH